MITPDDFEQVPLSSLTNFARALLMGGRPPPGQLAQQWVLDLKELIWWTVDNRKAPLPTDRPQPPPPSIADMGREDVEKLRAWIARLWEDLKQNNSPAAEPALITAGLIREAQEASRRDAREQQVEKFGTAEIVDDDDNDDSTS
jgi:hypothetical protein